MIFATNLRWNVITAIDPVRKGPASPSSGSSFQSHALVDGLRLHEAVDDGACQYHSE